MNARMILAVAVMLAVSTLAGELLGFAGFSGFEQWQLQPGIIGLIAAAFGGYIARARFVPVALLVRSTTIEPTSQGTLAAVASNT